VSLRGARAQDLIAEVLLRLDPWLPPGVRVEMTRHNKWLSLQRFAPGSERVGPLVMTPGPDGHSGHGGVTGGPGVGPWIPFLPKRLRAKLTAQDAVETVLDVAYDTGPGARPTSPFEQESTVTSCASPTSLPAASNQTNASRSIRYR
jgi:hypothetical protein